MMLAVMVYCVMISACSAVLQVYCRQSEWSNYRKVFREP